MSLKRPPLTAEQIALSEERKKKKAQQAQAAQQLGQSSLDPSLNPNGKILQRQWYQIQDTAEGENQTFEGGGVDTDTKLLAQCLVRRELFPTSDCLKAHQREHMIYNEVLTQKPDILCLQEVDRLEKLLPVIEQAGYAHVYASGPGKKHGCLIGFKNDSYEVVGQRLVQYDEQEVHSEGERNFRLGSSFRTKNIGHIVALKNLRAENGLIVATTHLFWHPRYTYERARQAGILKREVAKFRDENHSDWPCVIAGDFNFTPDDPAYSLAVGDSLLPAQEDLLQKSYVVHATIDPAVVKMSSKPEKEDDNEESADPDVTIVNARSSIPTDGLLSAQELQTLFSQSGPPLRSVYDVGLRLYRQMNTNSTEQLTTFGDRVTLPSARLGSNEPQWTSYTYYWKNSIDYLFVMDPPNLESSVLGVLSTPQTSELDPGIPRKGVCGSDHISLTATITFRLTPPNSLHKD
ncbi:RNA exonuclease ngl2 [Paramarasmius palmivorus]|uniref:RNA exonuclease ngl2 n=1 Tax=Paramarasmius palmivorus TaxID=297713 RepID=A0AAW0E417_9AGAR